MSVVQLEEQQAHQCRRHHLSTTRAQCGGPQGDSREGTEEASDMLSVRGLSIATTTHSEIEIASQGGFVWL